MQKAKILWRFPCWDIETKQKNTRISSNRPITIQYTASEVDSGNFLSDSVAGDTNTAEIYFSAISQNSSFFVDIDNDTNPEATGKIKITLNNDPAAITTYTVATAEADRSVEITILDDDAPELSIIAGSSVTEGTNSRARFRIISDIMPKVSATDPIYSSWCKLY